MAFSLQPTQQIACETVLVLIFNVKGRMDLIQS